MTSEVLLLPPTQFEESKAILRKVASAHRYLAELKGIAKTIPNQEILIHTLALQEAKDSSAIENIITTHDALYKEQLFTGMLHDSAAKEVSQYADALIYGFNLVNQNRLLSINHIVEIQKRLLPASPGLRTIPGTMLVNPITNEVVYTPPQDAGTVRSLMENLVNYININNLHEVDPLIKMAIIHYQFESIHPFYDGNGRVGRIINLLYLVLEGLLDLPILYLSRYIIQHKGEYYRQLQALRETNDWEPWLLYMLEAVEQTSKETIILVHRIRDLMLDYKHRIRQQFPKVYSQDLINNLFRHPYTKIDFLVRDLDVTRKTASKYLEMLTQSGFLAKAKIATTNYYMNPPLFELFMGTSQAGENTPTISTQQSGIGA